jgi:hypothetical protein
MVSRVWKVLSGEALFPNLDERAQTTGIRSLERRKVGRTFTRSFGFKADGREVQPAQQFAQQEPDDTPVEQGLAERVLRVRGAFDVRLHDHDALGQKWGKLSFAERGRGCFHKAGGSLWANVSRRAWRLTGSPSKAMLRATRSGVHSQIPLAHFRSRAQIVVVLPVVPGCVRLC